MRYVVHSEISAEIGNRLEKREANPMSFIQTIADRWKPEALYVGVSRRHLFMVVELNDVLDVGELSISLAHMTGQYPSIDPVMSMAEMGQMDQGRMDAMTQRIREIPDL